MTTLGLRTSALLGLLAATSATSGCTARLGDEEPLEDATADELLSSSDGFEPLGGVEPITCAAGTESSTAPRIWRLTRQQYDRTVSALLGDDSAPARDFLPEPGSEQGFQNDARQLRVRTTEATQFQNAAKVLAERAATERLGSIFPCSESELADAGCQRSFVEEFGARAFRRPLTEAEVGRYLGVFELGTQKKDGRLGLTATIEAMLQSPYFLYRFELGDFSPGSAETVTLTPYETAAALSFTVTDGPPDDELLARIGELDDPSVRRAEAERLLRTEAGRGALLAFFEQLFEYAGLPEVMKDPELIEDFDVLRGPMAEEFRLFVEDAVFEGGGLTQLLTSRSTFVDATLADHYGLSGHSGSGFESMSFGATESAGVLSLSGMSAVLSASTRTSPVNRGRFVRERLLCEHIPDPPAGVDINLPPLDPGLSAREQLDQKTSSPACSGCHALMNPVGFGMEAIDALGRYRTEDNGLPIDDTGELTDTRDANGAFEGTAELAHLLAGSEQVKECFAVQAFRYASGRGENGGDACTLVDVRESFLSGDLDLRELFVALVSHPTFVKRKP